MGMNRDGQKDQETAINQWDAHVAVQRGLLARLLPFTLIHNTHKHTHIHIHTYYTTAHYERCSMWHAAWSLNHFLQLNFIQLFMESCKVN